MSRKSEGADRVTAAREEFISEWGSIGGAWGLNRTMAQVHALLMTGDAVTTDEVMAALKISRGHAHQNLHELVSWGLVRNVIRKGERKEYYEAEKDVWRMFRLITRERTRREIEPALRAAQTCEEQTRSLRGSKATALHRQVKGLADFLAQAEAILDRVSKSEQNIFVPLARQMFASQAREGDSALQKSSPHIALLTSFNILSPHVSRFGGYVFDEMRRYFKAAGYPVRFYIGEGTARDDDATDIAEELLAEVRAGHVCGVASLYAPCRTLDWVQEITKRSIPLVGDYEVYPHTVKFPHRQWMAAAIQQMVAQGRRRVAMLCWHGNDQQIFQDTLAEYGLAYHPEWMKMDLHPNQRGAGWAELREIWSSRRERPDGLIIADDQFAPDVCEALYELGVRVPEQLTLVTHANRGCPLHVTLPMIKVEYDTIAHARLMGEMMLKLLRGERVTEPHVEGSAQFKIYPTAAFKNTAVSPLGQETVAPPLSEGGSEVRK